MRELGERAVIVLGNHDLHLVAQHEGFERSARTTRSTTCSTRPTARELVDWLRTRPLMHAEGNYAMVHAGLLPQWTIEKALALGARGAKPRSRRADYRDFLRAHVRQQARSAGATPARAGTACA